MKKPRFRFDEQYEAIYIYSASHKGYLFAFTFYNAGIKRGDSERTMIRKAKNMELKNEQ